MLMPRKTKFRKQMRGSRSGQSGRGNRLQFGAFGLQVIEGGMLSARQLEAGRRALTRHIKRKGKVWINVFPHVPVTQRAAEVRMGGGKGNIDHWAAPVRPGRVIFEIDGVEAEIAMRALALAGYKLPLKTTVLQREDHSGVA